VEAVEAACGLLRDPSAAPQWARPPMRYRYITAAMEQHFLEGVDAVPSLTWQLFAAYDPSCTEWEFRNRIEHMVMERGDICAYIHHWLRGHLAVPQPDHRNILYELMHMLTCFGRV